MGEQSQEATSSHEATYSGTLYVRPVGRGIVLEGIEGEPHLDDWMEQALAEAGVLPPGSWSGGGHTTDPVTLTLRIERSDAD